MVKYTNIGYKKKSYAPNSYFNGHPRDFTAPIKKAWTYIKNKVQRHYMSHGKRMRNISIIKACVINKGKNALTSQASTPNYSLRTPFPP